MAAASPARCGRSEDGACCRATGAPSEAAPSAEEDDGLREPLREDGTLVGGGGLEERAAKRPKPGAGGGEAPRELPRGDGNLAVGEDEATLQLELATSAAQCSVRAAWTCLCRRDDAPS